MTHEPIHRMFRHATGRFADRTAIAWGEQGVTYQQLAGRVGRVAAALRGAGAEPGSIVAILAESTADVIAAMLGVLEAGCAYMPLDLRFPPATLPAIVDEVRPRCWLIGPGMAELVERLRGRGPGEVIPLPEGWDGGGLQDTLPAMADDPDALSSVYFTSGSTGRPKGIAGRLKAIDHFVRWEVETFGVSEGTRVSQLTSPAFDAFQRDAFVPLVAGGTVCVPEPRDLLLDGRRLAAWIGARRIELLHCTPSLFRLVLAQELDSATFQALRHVLLAGEPLLSADVRRWHALFGDRIELVNLYGPTETTMVKLFYRVRPEDGNLQNIPIGKPMPGARAIVVDDRGQACPPGKLGEIYIRTPYRSHGYLNRPDLTREVFIQSPFSDKPGDIVYRTGDLGRVREDGNFEFLGRRDQQVKVRGVRVELPPIEDLLRSHEAVADVAVVDRTDIQGNKLLCAFVVLRREVEVSRLAELLRERLPEVMVPSAFVVLEALPRTLSGKVDRRALPDPGHGGRLGAPYAAPRTPAEKTLCAIFSELLSLPRAGLHDSFFELGGHSVLAALLRSRIRLAFDIELPLGQIFETPTVEGLALAVTRLQLAQESDASALLAEIRGLSDSALEEWIQESPE